MRNNIAILLLLVCSACFQEEKQSALVGAWKSKVQFQNGAFAAVKDLEFLYVFNAGGTMTESSNYDSAPPVPPAYGTWRELGPNQYEAKYEFFITRTPLDTESAAASGGWLPAGRGVLVEKIQIAADQNSFTSSIRFEIVDQNGSSVAGGGTATTTGKRLP